MESFRDHEERLPLLQSSENNSQETSQLNSLLEMLDRLAVKLALGGNTEPRIANWELLKFFDQVVFSNSYRYWCDGSSRILLKEDWRSTYLTLINYRSFTRTLERGCSTKAYYKAMMKALSLLDESILNKNFDALRRAVQSMPYRSAIVLDNRIYTECEEKKYAAILVKISSFPSELDGNDSHKINRIYGSITDTITRMISSLNANEAENEGKCKASKIFIIQMIRTFHYFIQDVLPRYNSTHPIVRTAQSSWYSLQLLLYQTGTSLISITVMRQAITDILQSNNELQYLSPTDARLVILATLMLVDWRKLEERRRLTQIFAMSPVLEQPALQADLQAFRMPNEIELESVTEHVNGAINISLLDLTNDDHKTESNKLWRTCNLFSSLLASLTEASISAAGTYRLLRVIEILYQQDAEYRGNMEANYLGAGFVFLLALIFKLMYYRVFKTKEEWFNKLMSGVMAVFSGVSLYGIIICELIQTLWTDQTLGEDTKIDITKISLMAGSLICWILVAAKVNDRAIQQMRKTTVVEPLMQNRGCLSTFVESRFAAFTAAGLETAALWTTLNRFFAVELPEGGPYSDTGILSKIHADAEDFNSWYNYVTVFFALLMLLPNAYLYYGSWRQVT